MFENEIILSDQPKTKKKESNNLIPILFEVVM